MIYNASRKVGGKTALLKILHQWSCADESKEYLSLRNQLRKNTLLGEIFAQIKEGEPYIEVFQDPCNPLPEVKVTYGHCYGGTCGAAHTHSFQKINGAWEILPRRGELLIH
ncbi:MAG: hypothetical protein ACJAVK_000656 [Akkermansiaceae bacterium]|jgi:hypothetical protein